MPQHKVAEQFLDLVIFYDCKGANCLWYAVRNDPKQPLYQISEVRPSSVTLADLLQFMPRRGMSLFGRMSPQYKGSVKMHQCHRAHPQN
jgi:hypothetical protein